MRHPKLQKYCALLKDLPSRKPPASAVLRARTDERSTKAFAVPISKDAYNKVVVSFIVVPLRLCCCGGADGKDWCQLRRMSKEQDSDLAKTIVTRLSVVSSRFFLTQRNRAKGARMNAMRGQMQSGHLHCVAEDRHVDEEASIYLPLWHVG